MMANNVINVQKSPFDPRLYQHITLKNKLDVLLIHEPTLDKASAAMNVGVGHFHDPKEFPGLAHFLEHMLFMGTAKYPTENEYSQFLSEHGGFSNAYTSSNHTNYYFEVSSDSLKGALDRFSQFFICPLFNEDGTERELLAVHSEHSKNLQNDYWRLNQLEKHLSKTDHVYHKFGTGNLSTLKTEPEKMNLSVRQALLDFHKSFYSANSMKLVVYGKESLEELTETVTSMFSHVPNRNVVIDNKFSLPLEKNHFNKLIKVKTIKDLRMLNISWQINDQFEFNRVAPEKYVAHLLGHEGNGSVLSYLKKKGWATSLSAGPSQGGQGFQFMVASVELTMEGFENFEKVVAAIFDYVDLIKHKGSTRWIFEENQRLNQIKFNFKEERASSSYASQVASNLQEYSPERCLNGPYLVLDYDPNVIEKLLGSITRENVRVFLLSNEFEDGLPFEKEPWYSTEFNCSNLNIPKLQDENVFHLPEPNPFIPTDTDGHVSPVEKKETFPELLIENDKIKVWYQHDEYFHVPKSYSMITFKSPNGASSAEISVAKQLFAEIIHHHLTEFAYAAELGGLSYEFSAIQQGFKLVVKGFHEKLFLFQEQLIDQILNYSFSDEQGFAMVKDSVSREYDNFLKESPRTIATVYTESVLQQTSYQIHEKRAIIKNILLSRIQKLVSAIFGQMKMELLVHGASNKESVLQLTQSICNRVQTLPAKTEYWTAVELGSATTFACENVENENSAIEVYFQIGHFSHVHKIALSHLFGQLFGESFFDRLRTKEQLGYIVNAAYRQCHGSVGVRFLIQSEKSPDYLLERISSFLEIFQQELNSMSQEKYDKHVQSIVVALTQAKKNIFQVSSQSSTAINSGFYFFNSNRKVAKAIQEISLDDARREMVNFFGPFPRLVVMVPSQKLKEAVKTGVDVDVYSMSEWKKTQKWMPVPKPMNKD